LQSARSDASSAHRMIPITPATRRAMGRSQAVGANVARNPTGCTECAMRNACVASDLPSQELHTFEEYARSKRKIRAGQHLYRSGDASPALYAVRTGFIATSVTTDDGREQVTGFHMMGDILGIDSIGGGVHAEDAVALEDTEVCEISLASLDRIGSETPSLQRKLYRMIGEQFQHEREAMLLLGNTRAEDRLASFLLSLGRRYAARGFSAVRFVLRMSRGEIGSYLGLRLETVSRLFSKFQAEGLLRVDSRAVEIIDPAGLKLVIGRSYN